MIERLKITEQIRRTEITATSVNGKNIPMLGEINLRINLQNKQLQHRFLVVKHEFQNEYDLILGYDLWKRFKITLNSNEGTIQCGNETISFSETTTSELNGIFTGQEILRAPRKLSIPPRSCHQVKLTNNAMKRENGKLKVIQGLYPNNSRPIEVVSSISAVNNSTIAVVTSSVLSLVLNPQ